MARLKPFSTFCGPHIQKYSTNNIVYMFTPPFTLWEMHFEFTLST